jgi:hypothetical protein
MEHLVRLLSSFSILLSPFIPFIVGHFSEGIDHPIFPVLEPKGGVPSGFEWEFDQGPDFYISTFIAQPDRMMSRPWWGSTSVFIPIVS